MKDWYNRHIAARWYASTSMWVAIVAGLVEWLPDWLQALNDNWGVAADAMFLSEGSRRVIQAVLLFVIVPIARAWRQEKMTQATIKQVLVRNLEDETDTVMVDRGVK